MIHVIKAIKNKVFFKTMSQKIEGAPDPPPRKNLGRYES